MGDKLIDTCFNFTHAAFRADEPAVLERALAAGVGTMLVTGSSVEDSHHAIELAARYPEHLFATAGVHPHLANTWTHDTRTQVLDMAAHSKVKAIGETGLDYNRNYSSSAEQCRAFEQQIELACELKLPLFLHLRDAHDEFMNVLSRYRKDIVRAVVHCFTGDGEQLDACLAMDLHVGITGWICDERRGVHLRALLKRIPPDRLMIETDAPYLLPRDLETKPKTRRNEPAFLPHILRTVADALERPANEVAATTAATAKLFFGLEDD